MYRLIEECALWKHKHTHSETRKTRGGGGGEVGGRERKDAYILCDAVILFHLPAQMPVIRKRYFFFFFANFIIVATLRAGSDMRYDMAVHVPSILRVTRQKTHAHSTWKQP